MFYHFFKKSILAIFFLTLFLSGNLSAQIIDSIYYGWAVHEYESDDGIRQCYLSSFPAKSDSNHTSERAPHLLITRYARKRTEEVSIYSGYEYKINSGVFILVNDIQFKFFTDNETAWLKTPAEDKEVIQMMLRSSVVKVRSDASVGTYAIDEYSMKGFDRAYARMKEICK